MVSIPSRLAIRLLGPVTITVDGNPLVVDTRKAVALLAYLATQNERQVRDRLCDLLWPDSPPARARATLRRTLSALRAGLGNRWIEADRTFVWLERDATIETDVDRFLELAQTGHDHDPRSACDDCVERLQEAAATYRSRFLDGFELKGCPDFDDWMLGAAEHFHRQAVSVLRRLTESLILADRLDEATSSVDRWIQLEPLAEEGHRTSMLLHAWRGDRTAAVRTYRACVDLLDRELGVEPLEETTELYEAILEHDVPPAPASRSRPPAVHPPVAATTDFIGREAEMRTILDVVRRGHGLVVVEGEVGVGKTRLLEEVSSHIDGPGQVVLVGSAHRAEAGVPYGPIQSAMRDALRSAETRTRVSELPDSVLRQAARLMPSLGEPARHEPDDPTAKSRFLDAIALLVGQVGPTTVLCIDNLHWSDEATIELIAYLVHRIRELGIVVIVTRRPEDTPADHPVSVLVDDVAGESVVLRLPRLSALEVARLVEGASIPELDAAVIYERSRGLPFFIVEYLAAARAGQTELPAAIRRLLLGRISSLDAIERQLVTTLAVIGTSADADTIRSVSGRSEDEVVSGVDRLISRGILREVGVEVDFTHEQLREVAYQETTLPRRRLLHRRTADHLAHRLDAFRDPAAIARAAHHRLQSGDEGGAAALAVDAGNLAAGVFANADALNHYAQALALSPDDPTIHLSIGEIRIRMGEYKQALGSLEAARGRLISAGSSAEAAQASLLAGDVYRRMGRWELAETEYEEALARATADEVRSVIAASQAYVLHRSGATDRARVAAELARTYAEKSGSATAMAQAQNLAGLLAEQPAARRAHLEAALALASDPRIRVAVLNNLALLSAESGDMAQAITYGTEALDQATAVGDVHRLAALHDNLADFHHLAGNEEQAMAHLKQAVTRFAQIDAQGDERQPAVWLLKEW